MDRAWLAELNPVAARLFADMRRLLPVDPRDEPHPATHGMEDDDD